ncbi:DUF3769 domain-containing protein [Gloeocapsa sp. PCC 73106]|uniref:DUF3769 domain-containing protein n=1 Tax=Gloeocapsa sp. PCC 73106 TaxID=102232 RepID=UPI0002AC7393|nr:DUF3769 domain-containing protein [Gloeocapsa sp. PCC 73106]ELR99068.1 organic solvent tolerance protein OstA [Gloeocapsa sp. PCC 73106]
MLSILLLAQASVTMPVMAKNQEKIFDLDKKPKPQLVSKGAEFRLSLAEGDDSTQEVIDVIEVIADQQEYDRSQQVITARGNVEVRFPKGILTADWVKINLSDRLAVAEGRVVLRRGEQTLRGERFEYNFFEDRGTINNASGEIFQPTLDRDFTSNLAEDETGEIIPEQPLGDRLEANQPLRRVVGRDGYQFVIGSSRDFELLDGSGGSSEETSGNISRLRFQALKLNFYPEGWTAEDIRFTNDPFSPPELEVRANKATFRNISEDIGQLTTSNSRIVLDQRTNIPILSNNLTIDRRPRRPSLIQFGFDGEERGGLFVQSSFELVNNDRVHFTLTPQYFLQKALFPDTFTVNNSTDLDERGGVFNSAVFGFKTRLEAQVASRTEVIATTDLPSLQLSEIDNKLRAKLALRQELGKIERPYLLSFEYNYRERLFNGSLGFQTVQSSLGVVFVSPSIPIGDSGINFRYQAGLQNIEAETDGGDLTTLMRFQTAASLSKDFYLWQGEALEATGDKGLRFTPVPVRPFLKLNTDVTGVNSIYGNGDNQPSLRFSVGIQGQIGHFSRSFFDYTGFSLRYSQGIRGEESPFLFDRFVDTSTISVAFTQQVYGPIRVGVQTSFSLNRSDEISTDYILEYSRRTHNVSLRYNPVLQIGSLNLRISDFNWTGSPEPFEAVQPVIQGVTR